MDDSPLPDPSSNIHGRLKRAFEARNYELLSELGRGGMGVVYLAEHKKLGRRVALKTLTPDRQTKESSILRFQREARTFAQIRHPHIATLYEYEDTGPIQYLALEYIEGTDLEKERRKRRKWTAREVAELMANLAGALDHTHEKQILHRDIKPGNILIENSTNRCVLTDFGLAKGEQDDTLTATGFAVGTPAYMAPEQITDQFGVKPDGRADLFSLATVAYEMLTQKHPFLAPDDLNTMRNIVNKQETPLTELDSSIPAEFASIIHKMMRKNPKERYDNAKIVEKELRQWLENPGSGTEDDATLLLPGMGKPSGAEAAPPPPPSSNHPTHPENPAMPPRRAPAKNEAVPQAAASAGGISTTTIIIIAVAGVLVLVLGIVIGTMMAR